MDGNNGKGKEQKKREAEERAMVQEAKRANKVKEAIQCCVQEWQKEGAAVYRHVPNVYCNKVLN